MNFELSEELVALRDIAQQALNENWSTEPARKSLDDASASAVPDGLWKLMAEMGWFGAGCEESSGGSGLGMTAAALLALEGGRVLLPSTLASTLAAAIVIDRSGNADLKARVLPGVIAGDTPATLALEEPNGTWGPEGGAVAGVVAGDVLSISGTKILEADGTVAAMYLCSVEVDARSTLLLVPAGLPGLTVTAMPRIDGQTLAELCFEGVTVPKRDAIGLEGEAGRITLDAYAVWTVLVAADLLGCAEAALAMTVEYSKQRMQFGRPIGAFQAVSHRLADIQVSVEVGRSLLYAACLALDERRADAYALVSGAKAYIGEAAVESCEAAVQLHGGIGYTWELDVHLYLRRARANSVTAGDATFHRDAVARYLSVRYA